MILLGIFDVLLWIFSGVFTATLGPLPDQVTSVMAYAFNLMADGFNFVYQVLIDKNVAVYIATWMLTTSGILFGIDIAVKILHAIKLDPKHQEQG